MNAPSKLGSAFLVLFGLPFLGMGLLAMFAFSRAANQSSANRIAGAAFASVFAIIGAGLIFGSLYGYASQKKQAEKELANPSSPWLWRQDWAALRVESGNKSHAIGWWIATVLVNLLTVSIGVLAAPKIIQTHDPKFAVPALFELIGLIVLAGAIRATIRVKRFGKTYFEMNSLPFSPGGRAAGAIHVQLKTEAPLGVDLNLSCVRRVVTGAGDNRSTQQVLLWEDSKNLPATSLNRGPLDTIVPVEFALPADAFQTNHDNPGDQVVWLLKARAKVPGVDYEDEFELPVFRTGPGGITVSATPWKAGIGSFRDRESATVRPSETSEVVAEPPQHRVVVNRTPEGQEFYFGAARNHGRALLVAALAVACTLLLWRIPQLRPAPPGFVLFGVVLMDLVLLLAFVHAVLSTSRIVVGGGTVRWRRSVFGLGKTRQVQISEIDSILPFTSVQQASPSGATLYSLRLVTKAGKSHTLADEIESRQEARWIVSAMEATAGLRTDTRVQISGGLYGPPPQPSPRSENGGSLPGGLGTAAARNNRIASALGFAGFLLFLGFMAHTMFRNMPARNGHTNIRKAGSGDHRAIANSFLRTAETRQASLQEVLRWPAQKQVEEIMARCADHDAAALKAFEENTQNWVGGIHLTDNLRQLEDRGRFSNDLRVRRVEADLELTLDGWAKTPKSADLLIDRVKSDKDYRKAALYFLGMLAGDGVEAKRAHELVLDYARHDSDPSVRQWATEGLRFVGTDEALDELFEIFTHDPSFSVRDRAGCNISDCGIFERKQRLAMVPRLIELAAAPDTNAQMRNWCFLALQEISDEQLPPDASAWRDWYRENGVRKRAQFEALDWWQVRGDS